MICAKCDYIMQPFDKECPRCHGKGLPQQTVQTHTPSPQVVAQPGLVKCPYCAEDIQPNAKKCRHCGEWLGTNQPVQSQRQSGNGTLSRAQNPKGVGLVLPQPQPNKLHNFMNLKLWPTWLKVCAIMWGVLLFLALPINLTWVFSIFVLTIILPAVTAYTVNYVKIKQQIAQTFGNFDGFSVNQKYLANWNTTGIAIDSNVQHICLLNVRQNYIHQTLLSAPDLIDCEIVEGNHSSVTRDSGCALTGCLFFGLPGLLIGGLTGPKRTTGKVTRIELKITVNDINEPHHTITFLNGSTSDGSVLYRGAREQADHWLGLIKVLMNRG